MSEINETSGFYKFDEYVGELFCGPNFVKNMNYELFRDEHETYEYPVDGWYWFDSNEEARTFFNLHVVE